MMPNQSLLGPTFKQDAKKVSDALIEAGARSLKEVFDHVEEMELALADGTIVSVTADMVIFEELVPEGIAGSESDCGMVYVNAKLTRELEAEGYSREAIRRIQDMRKELDLAVDEQIIAEIQVTDAHVSDLIQSMTEAIASEVRAGEILKPRIGFRKFSKRLGYRRHSNDHRYFRKESLNAFFSLF